MSKRKYRAHEALLSGVLIDCKGGGDPAADNWLSRRLTKRPVDRALNAKMVDRLEKDNEGSVTGAAGDILAVKRILFIQIHDEAR